MNKIKNAKVEILPNEKIFNDYDMLVDTGISLKHLNTEYGMLKQEASHKELTDLVEKISKDISKYARDIFNLLFELGWYELTEEDPKTIKEAYNKFQKYQKNM